MSEVPLYLVGSSGADKVEGDQWFLVLAKLQLVSFRPQRIPHPGVGPTLRGNQDMRITTLLCKSCPNKCEPCPKQVSTSKKMLLKASFE